MKGRSWLIEAVNGFKSGVKVVDCNMRDKPIAHTPYVSKRVLDFHTYSNTYNVNLPFIGIIIKINIK